VKTGKLKENKKVILTPMLAKKKCDFQNSVLVVEAGFK
jgi:hypothetical protein